MRQHIHRRRATTVLAAACLTLSMITGCGYLGVSIQAPATSEDVVGLIVKTTDNPYFVALREGAEQEGATLGVKIRAYAGTYDGDTETQIRAIEDLIRLKAKGILITPSGAEVLTAVAKARTAGMLVIALDSPTDPTDAVDATFATDNFGAGLAIGQWARMQRAPATALIAMLDLNKDQIPVDVSRDQGFLSGYGIQIGNPAKFGEEPDKRVVGHAYTDGSVDGGKNAMTELLAKNPKINLVYTINEPAAEGAYQALKAAGKQNQALIVSVDGGCTGVRNVASGIIGATAMQFPLRMARLGLDAVIDYALTGDRPANSPGLGFFNTGVQLITDRPMPGLYSKDTSWGNQNCWG